METNVYLRAWRLQRGLMQKDLSRQAGVTQAQVSRIESLRQTASIKTIEKLTKTLGIGVADLLAPPPPSRSPLSRHDIQEIADAVVNGTREMEPDLNRLADAVASLVGQKLNAHLAPGRRANSGKRLSGKFRSVWVQRAFPESLLNEVLARVDKKFV